MSVTAKHHFPQALAGIAFLFPHAPAHFFPVSDFALSRQWCGLTHVGAGFLPRFMGFLPRDPEKDHLQCAHKLF
jgi:hypothetical protein